MNIPGKIIFKTIVGSQAYGTSIPNSDVDFKGVYIQNEDDLHGFGYKEQVDHGKDECYYEVRRFLQLLESANPTVLELLYSPEECVLVNSPEFTLIQECRDKFLTKGCKMSFGGYAVAQIKKARGLEKKMNWEIGEVKRKTPLDFCYIITILGTVSLREWLLRQKTFNQQSQENYGVCAVANARDMYFIYPSDGELGYHGIISKDEKSNDLRLSSIPKEEILKYIPMSYNKDGYIKHCKDYNSYQEWLSNRNTQRYVDVEGHGQKIDGKNLMHCRRLLDVAIEIANEKTIRVKRPNRQYLLDIRQGKVNLDEIINQAENDLKTLNDVYNNSDLPDGIDRTFVNDLLLKVRRLNGTKSSNM